jgi:hypothetical protein
VAVLLLPRGRCVRAQHRGDALDVELRVSADCNAFVENLIIVGDGLPSPIMLVQLKDTDSSGAKIAMGKDLARALWIWESIVAAQEHQPAYSALSVARVLVLAPGGGQALPTSAKGNVIRSKCEMMYRMGE